jgi:HPt (histidine-containing phosphotransfer) domain-containing protein
MAARPRHPAERAPAPRPPPLAREPAARRAPPPPDHAGELEPALDPTALAALRALDRGAGEILRTLLDVFLDDAYELILLIEDAIASNQPEYLSAWSRQLATTAAQVGAADIAALCLDLDLLAARGQTVHAAALMDALRKAFDLAEAEIHEHLANGH